MRRSLMFIAAALLFSSVAAAQNISAAVSSAPATPAISPDPAPQMAPSVRDDFPWQLSMGYQYMYFDFRGFKANMSGTNTTIVRYFNDHLGVEGSIATEFGRLNPAFYGRMILYDGGVRWTFHRTGKWEPWVHGDAGGAYLRETASSGPFTFNGFVLIAGGGVDYSFHRRFSIRMQADYTASRLNAAWQNSISAGGGIVLNF